MPNKNSKKYSWNLDDIYPDEKAWQRAKDRLVDMFGKIDAYRGRIASASHLLACLELHSGILKDLGRLIAYVTMRSDEDTRDAHWMGLRQEMTYLRTEYETRSSFIEPELVKIDEATITGFLEAEPALLPYRMFLLDIIRRKPHTLSDKEERILAETGLVAEGPHSIFTIFSNAEFPYPEISLKNGKIVRLDPVGFSRYRTLPDRDERQKVFEAFFTSLSRYQGTLGAQLDAQMKRDVFYARVRHYPSTLAKSLDKNNIPQTVFHNLLESVHAHMDTFHRYLQLKKRLLNLPELAYHDLYAPVCDQMKREIEYDEGIDLIVQATDSMGREYNDVVQKALKERWIDVYPSKGKRSGAYMNDGGYDVHPYILLNYNDQYNDVSTLAHEIGHALHTYFSNQSQPFPTSQYSIFVAEVASTFQEALLHHRMLKDTDDTDMRLALQMEYLDGVRGTLFRQAQFAEFELRIHEMAELGKALTGEKLNEIYGEILRKYCGHEKGICTVGDLVNTEWAYVPHFYYDFYVYQYATSFTASTAFHQNVLEEGQKAADRFIRFLSTGGEDYPINLLKSAGIDMTSPEPFEITMKVINTTMVEIEGLLDQQ